MAPLTKPLYEMLTVTDKGSSIVEHSEVTEGARV